MKIRVLASISVVLWAASLTAQDGSRPVTGFVRTERGFVNGLSDGNVDQFLGIPYAAPPVGDLRWKPPVPPARWQGVRDATQKGSECVQAPSRLSGDSSTVRGSEDCLYLNVYRPAATKAKALLPVMIWVHGGSNLNGSGNDYDPNQMVAKTGIVVVTINYRLNVFGFLALPSLDAESGDPSSGNFGIQDQQAAMRWVRENILAFGGNPLNITVAGESAGGIDLCANLVSPAAAGLFHRAILESMYCPTATHDEAIQVSTPVATGLGCTDSQTAASCMRAKPAADVIAAAGQTSGLPGGGAGFNASPNFGNSLLPLSPADAFRSGKWNRSTILLGSNHDEAALVVVPAILAKKVKLPLSEQTYERVVTARFGSFAPSVLAEYPAGNYRSPLVAYSDLSTDRSPVGCAVTTLADSFAAVTQTYRYEFDDPNAPLPGVGLGLPAMFSLGAYHGAEVQFLFGMRQLPGPRTEAQKQLSGQMIQYWANFAKSGDPNGPGLTPWPRYDARSHQLLSLRPDGNTVIDNFDTDHHCAFWAAAPVAPILN